MKLAEVVLELADHLLEAELATASQVEAALWLHVRHALPFPVALFEVDPLLWESSARELERRFGPGVSGLEPDPVLLEALPAGLCSRLLGYPIGVTSSTGVVDLLCVDPTDRQLATEFAHHFGRPVRLIRGDLAEVRSALRGLSMPAVPLTERQDASHMNQSPALDAAEPGATAPGDSLPPIPLVRRPAVVSSVLPGTRRGVAPPQMGGAIAGRSAPNVVGHVAPSRRGRGAERRGALERVPVPVSSSADLVHPGSLRVSLGAGASDTLEGALSDLAVAGDPEQVVEALVAGMAPLAEEAIVFAVRGTTLRSRVRLNYAGQTERFADLDVKPAAACAVNAALELGQFLGPPSPEDLLLFVGQPAEVVATRVQVSGRSSLVLAAAGFRDSFEVSRRAERLARAASDALQRIVRARKR